MTERVSSSGERPSIETFDGAGITIFNRAPAYQQVLKGLPAIDYSVRDIVYRSRNVRAHRVYGYSPVQQVLMTVNIALRRQLWQLDYFSEGSIPDALIGVPAGWTPDQIRQFQDYWDTEFVGDLARRRRAKFVPGESAVKVHQTKEPEHKQDFDEWLARIICYAFSVPPQWAVKLMNRATAGTPFRSLAHGAPRSAMKCLSVAGAVGHAIEKVGAMIPFKSPLQLTVPPTLEKKLEALAALRTLQAQDEELMRERRAAIAALRQSSL